MTTLSLWIVRSVSLFSRLFILFTFLQIAFVWPSRWSFGKVMFFLNRYSPIIDTILANFSKAVFVVRLGVITVLTFYSLARGQKSRGKSLKFPSALLRGFLTSGGYLRIVVNSRPRCHVSYPPNFFYPSALIVTNFLCRVFYDRNALVRKYGLIDISHQPLRIFWSRYSHSQHEGVGDLGWKSICSLFFNCIHNGIWHACVCFSSKFIWPILSHLLGYFYFRMYFDANVPSINNMFGFLFPTPKTYWIQLGAIQIYLFPNF